MVSREELAALDLQYRTILTQKTLLEQRLRELEEAEAYLKEKKVARVYKSVGPVLVEMGKEEALAEIKKEKEESQEALKLTEVREKQLRKKLEEILKEIKGGGTGA